MAKHRVTAVTLIAACTLLIGIGVALMTDDPASSTNPTITAVARNPALDRALDGAAVRVVDAADASAVLAVSGETKVGVTLGAVALIAVIFAYRRRHAHPYAHEPPPDLQHSEPQSSGEHPESQPLFMNTTAGRDYRADQADNMQVMTDEMQAIEHALADTAESLEQSNTAIIALRHHIHDELIETTADPEDVPADLKPT